MGTTHVPPEQNYRQNWKLYLPTTSLEDGNYYRNCLWKFTVNEYQQKALTLMSPMDGTYSYFSYISGAGVAGGAHGKSIPSSCSFPDCFSDRYIFVSLRSSCETLHGDCEALGVCDNLGDCENLGDCDGVLVRGIPRVCSRTCFRGESVTGMSPDTQGVTTGAATADGIVVRTEGVLPGLVARWVFARSASRRLLFWSVTEGLPAEWNSLWLDDLRGAASLWTTVIGCTLAPSNPRGSELVVYLNTEDLQFWLAMLLSGISVLLFALFNRWLTVRDFRPSSLRHFAFFFLNFRFCTLNSVVLVIISLSSSVKKLLHFLQLLFPAAENKYWNKPMQMTTLNSEVVC